MILRLIWTIWTPMSSVPTKVDKLNFSLSWKTIAPPPHFLYHIKLCPSFQSHRWIQTSVTIRKRSIWVKIKLFAPCDLEIWWMTSKNNRAPFSYYVKLSASLQSHCWIRTWVTARNRSMRVKIGDFFVLCDLEIWQKALKNNKTPLLCLYNLCASFRNHWWFQTGATVWKLQIWSKSTIFVVWPWKLTDDIEKQ